MQVSFLSREAEVKTWVLELSVIKKKKQKYEIKLGSCQVTSLMRVCLCIVVIWKNKTN